MNPTRTCPQCQQLLPADAPEGLCPVCVMQNLAASQAGDRTEILPPGSTPAQPSIDIGNPAEVAKRLPQFEIIELLGRGGMGVVYKARQVQLDREVALKILPPEDSVSTDFIARFTREARSLAKLNHPNIVTVHDFGESNGLYYFIMEFVDGANLRQLLQAKKLTADQALAIVPKVCDALEYAHEEGVVHRDIKPENILIDKKGRVKIADFGLAKLLRREALDMTLTLAGSTLGTLRYMAPEQMDKPESVDHRADIYSLGVVIYEMLTGETPVGRFQLPSQKASVDTRLDDIVLHALEKEPDRRYQHASEVKTDVENVTSRPRPAAVAVSPEPPVAAAPIRMDEAEPAAVRPLPRFFWLRAFGLLMLGWLVVAALWNFRMPGCLLGALVLSGITVELAIRHVSLKPCWLREWRKGTRLARVIFTSGYVALGVIPFMALLSAMEAKWETSSLRWNWNAKSAEEFAAEYEGKEHHLIQGLTAFKDDVPTTELAITEFAWRSGFSLLTDIGPHSRSFGPVVITLLVAGASVILLFFFQQIVGAEKFSVWRVTLDGWRPSFQFMFTVIGSAVLAYVILATVFIFTRTAKWNNDFNTSVHLTNASTKQVELAMQKWAVENGYWWGDSATWNLRTVPKGQTVAQTAIFNAWKPSPFDRWHMTWTGMKKMHPHVAVRFTGTEKPAECSVILSANMNMLDKDDEAYMKRVMKSMEEAMKQAAKMDAKKPLEDQITVKDDDAASSGVSGWWLFAGVLGLSIAWSVVRYGWSSKEAVPRSSQQAKDALCGCGNPRLSRCALWGAILASLAACLLVAFLLGRLSSPFFVIGVASPFAATILGGIALAHIKRSGGKLYGLRLAFADVALFPILLLHGAMAVMLGLLIVTMMKIAGVNAGLGLLEMGLLAMLPLIADFFIVRALWRKVAGKPTASGGDIGSKLNLAAIGLLLAGIVNALAGLVWIGVNINTLVAAAKQGAPMAEPVVMLLLSLGSIAVVYYTIGSALFLMHRKDDGDITFPLVMAALVPPGCIFGLPAAIYALVLLSKPEVKALFPQAKPEAETATEPEKIFRREVWWFSRMHGTQKVMSVMLGVVLMLSLICFFSFRMQATTTADHSGVVRNLYDVTVGLGDPWLYILHHKTGTRGGMTSGMNFVAGSALFGLAALFAGTALTRLTREQKRRAKLADASSDRPQSKFFWQAVAGAAFFIAGGAGVIVHQAKIDLGPRWADAKQVHPDFTRPGVTSLALKKEIAEELRLTQQQLEQVNAILSRAYLDFLKLENDHSLFRSVKGRLVKEVKPFPDRSFDLAQRLAQELHAITDKDIIDTPVRGEVWRLRLFRHAGECNVRAEIWQQEGKFHVEDVWERDGEKISGKSGEVFEDLRVISDGAYVLDWEAEKDILHESKPDDETTGFTKGWDTMQVFIDLVRQEELARWLNLDPKVMRAAANPHAALVTHAGTTLGRSSAEVRLKLHGIPFSKEMTPEELVTKLEALLGKPTP